MWEHETLMNLSEPFTGASFLSEASTRAFMASTCLSLIVFLLLISKQKDSATLLSWNPIFKARRPFSCTSKLFSISPLLFWGCTVKQEGAKPCSYMRPFSDNSWHTLVNLRLIAMLPSSLTLSKAFCKLSSIAHKLRRLHRLACQPLAVVTCVLIPCPCHSPLFFYSCVIFPSGAQNVHPTKFCQGKASFAATQLIGVHNLFWRLQHKLPGACTCYFPYYVSSFHKLPAAAWICWFLVNLQSFVNLIFPKKKNHKIILHKPWACLASKWNCSCHVEKQSFDKI